MKSLSAFLVVLSLLAPVGALSQARERIYKCDDVYTDASREGCVPMAGGTITVVPSELHIEELKRAAESGDAWAQTGLGDAYRAGLGVTADHSEAIRWYRMAALQGHAVAQSTLGYLYRTGGVGHPKDPTEAAKWFRLAADQGDVRAQTLLGLAYEEGHGVIQDYEQAKRWLHLAAVQGSSLAQFRLGIVLSRQGPTLEHREAVKWFRAAAVQGNELAQGRLASAYASGRGVPQDFVRAHMWFNVSAVSGDELTAKLRDSVAAQMTPKQIAEAQKMARDCLARNFKNCD